MRDRIHSTRCDLGGGGTAPPESDVAVATVRDYLLSHKGGLSISTAVMGFAAMAVIDVAEDLSSTGSNLGPLGLIALALFNVWIVATSVRVLTERHSR